jgi:hypothetical protein
MSLRVLPTLIICRHAPLLASYTLTVLLPNPNASLVKSCEKDAGIVEQLWRIAYQDDGHQSGHHVMSYNCRRVTKAKTLGQPQTTPQSYRTTARMSYEIL